MKKRIKYGIIGVILSLFVSLFQGTMGSGFGSPESTLIIFIVYACVCFLLGYFIGSAADFSHRVISESKLSGPKEFSPLTKIFICVVLAVLIILFYLVATRRI